MSKAKSVKKKSVGYKMPKLVKNKETKVDLQPIFDKYVASGMFTEEDVPQFNRMVTAYDAYITNCKILSIEGYTMVNLKGEIVKRPEANLKRENWTQYFDIAKEYGFTAKSKQKMKVLKMGTEVDKNADITKILSGNF